MKNNIVIKFLPCVLFLQMACAPARHTAEVSGISGDGKTILLKSVGYGKLKESSNENSTGILGINKLGKIAIEDAEKNAFRILMFQGIPNTSYSNPLVEGGEDNARKLHSEYLDAFFKSKKYTNFITESKVVDNPHISRNIVTATIQIGINVVSLRKELEGNNVIRKFGF